MELASLILAAYRVTRLLNRDAITKPLQRQIPSQLVNGWFCPWCLGFWVSLGVVLLVRRRIDPRVLAEVFAVSAGVGLATLTEDLITTTTEALAERPKDG